MIPGDKKPLSGMVQTELEQAIEASLEGLTGEVLDDLYEESVRDFVPGSILPGNVIAIQGDDVVIDIGYKSEGFVPLREFDTPDEIDPGDEVEVYLEAVEDESGLVVLSKRKADRIRGWERIIRDHEVGDTVTGRAIRKIKGGLLVDIGVPVFLPASQIDIRRVGDVSEFVGRDMTCKIIKIDKERHNIVLSRRRLLEEEREAMKAQLFSEIQRGEIRRGVVKNITDFGAFIDLGGVDGLLHITDMSWSRVSHPREVLNVDQVVDVKVLDFELERERISLGLKQLTPNPWTAVPEKYPVGSRIQGEVVSIMPYGAFVKLEEGVEGLVHISEMSWTQQINHPSELVKPGDMVEVIVLEINQDKQEISLGMKQVEDNPWDNVGGSYPVGAIVRGTVRNMTGYGAFIALEDGIDGLLHISDMSWTKKVTHPSNLLEKGQEIEAAVLSVDTERKRIALGMKQLEEDPWDGDIPRRYSVGQVVKGVVTKLTSFGAFVEIEEGLEGLLHISELAESKVDKPKDVLNTGDEVEVKIINVDPVERKIGLSLRAAGEPEAGEVEAAPKKPVEQPGKFAAQARKQTRIGQGVLAEALSKAVVIEEDEPEAPAEEEKAEEEAAEEAPAEEPAAEEPAEEAPAEEEKAEEPAEEEAPAEEAPAEEEKADEPAEEEAPAEEAPAEEAVEEAPAEEEKPKKPKKAKKAKKAKKTKKKKEEAE